jgi:hypothetical protein
MTAQHDTTRRSAPNVRGGVESVSTRVLLDGTPRRCHTCGDNIAAGAQYKCLTVRAGDGSITQITFCDGDCRAQHTAGPRAGER